VHHRGVPGRPGLVLGLAAGGAVRGVAYRIADDIWPQTYEYLREREQPTETYVESRATVRLADGRRVEAMVFLSDTRHPQWAGGLDRERQAQLIAGSRGLSGRNIDYLRDLVEHLREAGVRDQGMEWLLARVDTLEPQAAG
jgi:cation transport protein ChaC